MKTLKRQRHCLVTYIESTNELLDTLLIASEVLSLGNHCSMERYCHPIDGRRRACGSREVKWMEMKGSKIISSGKEPYGYKSQFGDLQMFNEIWVSS